MRYNLLLASMLLLTTLSAAQAIDTSTTALIGYFHVGSPINLAKLNLVMQYTNSSGLFPAAITPNQQTNFTEGEVWWIAGDDGNSNFCASLPYLQEDGVDASERAVVCPTRFGYSGDSIAAHPLLISKTATTVTSCGTNCPTLVIRVRVRADGWIMAYTPRPQVATRAGLLHWRKGGRGLTTAIVDDTVLGITLNRTLQILNSSGAIPPVNFTYNSNIVSYYDFEIPTATSILIGGRGTQSGGYSANTYGWGFSTGSRPILNLSMSMRAHNSQAAYYIKGFRFMCINSNNADTEGSTHMGVAFNIGWATSAPLAACAANTTYNTWAGGPFMALTIPTNFNITANTFNNVTSDSTEMKAAVMMYLG